MMIEQDVGRVSVVQRGSKAIVGLLARKDLLRTRSHLSAAERDRTRYFAPSTSRANHIEASSAGNKGPTTQKGSSVGQPASVGRPKQVED